MDTEVKAEGIQKVEAVRTHLDPKYFYLEVVDHLWPAGRLDILRLCGHANVNGDLEVILLLADKGLISGRVEEALVCVNVVGRRRSVRTVISGGQRYLDNYWFSFSLFRTYSVW